MNDSKKGYSLVFEQLSQPQLEDLWQMSFPKGSSPICFNGLISRYELTRSEELPTQLGQSLSGKAFDTVLELRWKQILPGHYSAVILVENEVYSQKLLAAYGQAIFKEYTVTTNRHDNSANLITYAGKGERDRRIPAEPRDVGSIGYLYYLDTKSALVRYTRLVARGGK